MTLYISYMLSMFKLKKSFLFGKKMCSLTAELQKYYVFRVLQKPDMKHKNVR